MSDERREYNEGGRDGGRQSRFNDRSRGPREERGGGRDRDRGGYGGGGRDRDRGSDSSYGNRDRDRGNGGYGGPRRDNDDRGGRDRDRGGYGGGRDRSRDDRNSGGYGGRDRNRNDRSSGGYGGRDRDRYSDDRGGYGGGRRDRDRGGYGGGHDRDRGGYGGNRGNDNYYNDEQEIKSELVRAGRRTYFFDVKATRADDYYMTITESKKFTNDDGTFHFKKHKIYLYKEDFAGFQQTLNDMIDFIYEKKGEERISGGESSFTEKNAHRGNTSAWGNEPKDDTAEEDLFDPKAQVKSNAGTELDENGVSPRGRKPKFVADVMSPSDNSDDTSAFTDVKFEDLGEEE